jgi:hypothetical protein
MPTEWIVAAVLGIAGLLAAVGFYLGERDPVTRAYKPSGSFLLGRIKYRSEFPQRPGRKDANQGVPEPGRGKGHDQIANDGPRAGKS